MATRCALLGMRVLLACEGASPEGSEVPVEIAEGSIEQFAPRDDDQIERSVRGLVDQPEDLSNEAFSPVSPDGVTKLPRRHDAKPGPRHGPGGEEQGEISG